MGSMYKSQLVGTFGDIGTLSFYPAHHITMGEGGAVFMKSAKLRKIAESLRDWGGIAIVLLAWTTLVTIDSAGVLNKLEDHYQMVMIINTPTHI